MKTTALTLLLASGGVAQAGLVASFSYENLASNYDAGSQTLTTQTMASSTGSVTRELNPAGFADFGQGSADYALELEVSNVMIDGATGVGSMVASDLNGDTLTADVSGDFEFVPFGGTGLGIIFFNGSLSNVFFNDVSGDGSFDGDTSAFGLDFSAAGGGPFTGGIQRLQISEAQFFDGDFGNMLAEVDGQIIPAPAGTALLTLMGIGVARRRRR
jgi:hypothetical protein